MTPKNNAFTVEFPWLAGHLKKCQMSLHCPKLIIRVSRVDERLLHEVGTDGESHYGVDQDFLFLDEFGNLIAGTLKEPRWLRMFRACTFPVSEVLDSLTLHQLARVYYVLEVRRSHNLVIIHKPPMNFRVDEWLRKCRADAKSELASQLETINSV